MELITKDLIKVFKKFKEKKLFLHEPSIKIQSDLNNLKDCVFKKQVSALGDYVNKFEKRLSEITGSKYVIATNSGTSGLHISCLLSGIKEGEEVLVPAFTFVASVNSILYSKGIPHFIDIKQEDLSIDFKKLDDYLEKISKKRGNKIYNKTTNRVIRAIMVVHPFGHPADCDLMLKVSKKYNLIIIEDAADALGSYFKKKHVGTFGIFGVLSFNGNKTVTCGSGGAILTNKKKMAIKARSLISTSKINHKFKFLHSNLGYNYRLSNINAALGLSQLIRLKHISLNKKKLMKFYLKEFEKRKYIKIFKETKNKKYNYWLFTGLFTKKYKIKVDKILSELITKGIFLRKGWELMTKLNYLKKFPKMDLSVSEELQPRLINLPSSSFLGEKIAEKKIFN